MNRKSERKRRQGMTRHLKTDEEIAMMRRAGLLTWEAHQAAAALIRPGVTTAEIDAAVERHILEKGGIPLFKGVKGETPYPASTCISINSEVVHGIPGPRELREGDIVSVDIGVKLDGWCGDAAVTHPVGKISPEAQHLLAVTEESLRRAIRWVGEKERWSQVGREIARYVESEGFSVVEALVGHTIGRDMWEGLQAPNYSNRDFEQRGDFLLQPGLVIAIEPMVNVGVKEVHVLEDKWTIVTADGKLSAHFEHTVAITPNGAQALTVGPDGTAWSVP